MKNEESEDKESEEEEEKEEDECKREEESRRGGQCGEEGAVSVATQQLDSFSIKDVKESLSYFNEEGKLLIDHWISDFEDTSALLGWNDLQNFIYGKRMEFQVNVNSTTIHKQLSKRRQQQGESSRLYIYSMQKIAKQNNIEEDVRIQYMADGLLGERRYKAILYGSRTLKELKNNIQIFDKLKESNVQGTRFRKDIQGNVASARIGISPAIKKDHCYGCGSEAHSYRFCPDKEKGLKCFKCNNFGYIASHCNKSQQPSEKKQVSIVFTLIRKELRSGLMLNNKLGRPRLYERTRRLAGFGNAITKPIGRFEVNIDIEDGRYKTDVFVVSRSDMRYEDLLG
ncbi:hypothetical protein M0804_013423 [Polistes exclamans]|nr:hypothetical protein M0804_013423 [Polistes exclamans]